jgi:hypothetical protein
MLWSGSIWLRISSCEHNNEHSGSLKCWKVLELLHSWQASKEGLSAMKLVVPNASLRIPSNLMDRRSGGGVQLGPLGTSPTNWPIIHGQGDYEDGEFGGMMIGRGNRSTDKGMVQSDMSKPALIFFLLQECTQQNPLSKF